MTIKYTRKDYMNNDCSDYEYYSQFVTQGTIDTVSSLIGEERIKNSKCDHFNDIPLKEWDRLPCYALGLSEAGETRTLGVMVCINKAAAKTIRGW